MNLYGRQLKYVFFFVDGEIKFYFSKNNSSLPLIKDFFEIMNVAAFLEGLSIPAFQESTLEVDYVRVYQ
jgi:hypothetical protein